MTHRDACILLTALGLTMSCARAQQPIARNLDKALDEEISVNWSTVPLEKVIGDLRAQTNTNIIVNWPALAKISIPRDAPITLRLKSVPYEAVARSILLVLAPHDAGLNYVVGDNALEITTNADLSKTTAERIFDISPLLTKGAIPETLKTICRSALAAAGERVKDPDPALTIQDGILTATLSRRGEVVIRKMLAMCQSPVKIGPRVSPVPGTAESVREKKTAATIHGMPLDGISASTELNTLRLPGAADRNASLTYFIDDAGIIEIGTTAELAARTLPGVYDLAELLKRRSAKSNAPAAAELDNIVTQLKPCLPAVPSPVLLGQSLVIFAPIPLHRQIATQLQDIYVSPSNQ